MSIRIGNIVIIEPEENQQCDYCGKIAELRPYGPNRECICYHCGMQDEKTTNKMMGIILFGDEPELETKDNKC